MNNSNSYKWKGVDKKISQLSDKEILEIFIFKQLSPYITFLTRFFPFSFFWQDRRFHHKHRTIVELDDLIIKTAGEKDFWFKIISYEKDDRFLNVVGKFTPLKKNASKSKLLEYFRLKMTDKDFYINELEDGNIKISLLNKNI